MGGVGSELLHVLVGLGLYLRVGWSTLCELGEIFWNIVLKYGWRCLYQQTSLRCIFLQDC
jgi:hypothetical protein